MGWDGDLKSRVKRMHKVRISSFANPHLSPHLFSEIFYSKFWILNNKVAQCLHKYEQTQIKSRKSHKEWIPRGIISYDINCFVNLSSLPQAEPGMMPCL